MMMIYYYLLGELLAEVSQTFESSLGSHYATSGELLTSPSVRQASPGHGIPPDVLANTLDLKRTLRRWSQDKEQVCKE